MLVILMMLFYLEGKTHEENICLLENLSGPIDSIARHANLCHKVISCEARSRRDT